MSNKVHNSRAPTIIMNTSPSPFCPPLEHALHHALNHLHGLDDSPVAATATLHALRERLAKPLNARPLAAERVIDELVADTAGGITGSAGGRFFGNTTWRGKRCMRVSVCNWQTGEADVARAIAAVANVLSERRS